MTIQATQKFCDSFKPMTSMRFKSFCAALLLVLLPSLGNAAPLRIVLTDSNTMPLADIQDFQLKGGMLFELGNAIAQEMGRKATFITLPRKRIAQALIDGKADLICNQNQAWLVGPFDWSKNFIPHVELLVSNQNQVRPMQMSELSNIPIGTILGFNYVEMRQQLGNQFIRDDSLGPKNNLLKLNAGHVNHIIIPQYILEYQQKIGNLKVKIHPYLVIKDQPAACAVSRSGQIKLADLNRAITNLEKRNKLKPIFERYR